MPDARNPQKAKPMDAFLQYDPTAARRSIPDAEWTAIEPALETARREVLADVSLMESGDVPDAKQPLDAGFIHLPQRLLAERANTDTSLLDAMIRSAGRLRSEIERLVVLGIGGSYMGLRALAEALQPRLWNELSRDQRQGAPRLYYEGENLDNDALQELLQLLRAECRDPDDLMQRWGIVVISKSGGTLETAAAFRILRKELEAYYGAERAVDYVVPITGAEGKLRDLAQQRGYRDVFPVPDGVGGRFSVFSAVGLYPAAVLGIDIAALLQGAAEMTERFATADIGDNPVLDYVATCHLWEQRGATIRVLSTWGKRLEAVGLWYDQLLAESLGKQERGTTPITVVNTRDLHSRGQQHQEGRRDRLITNVIVEHASGEPVTIPQVDAAENQDGLNDLAGRGVPELLAAAIAGTNEAYAGVSRPTADIRLPRLDERTLGQLLQMLMLATAVEGRLIGINPYGQPGVEAYKQNMKRILFGT